MCYRGSRTGVGGREFAGCDLVDGGVRGLFFFIVMASLVRYTSGVRLAISIFQS